ncbi:MAG: hypothetical protein K5918_07770 [Bacteroidales bacterium]|nr:hypothetical protein [Bacteroidales bacterium]
MQKGDPAGFRCGGYASRCHQRQRFALRKDNRTAATALVGQNNDFGARQDRDNGFCACAVPGMFRNS